MSDYCPPPPYQEPPPLRFDVHETVIEGATTYEADLGYRASAGYLADEFTGVIPDFYNYRATTIDITKTLELIGPVPILIKWKHHSVVWRSSPTDPGYDDTITDGQIILTVAEPSYTWPLGFEDPGAEIEDFTSEFDDTFTAHRAV